MNVAMAEARQGMLVAMREARQLCHEELHKTFRELEQLRQAYTELAVKHHRAMRDRAVDEALHERQQNPFKPLH
jgi:hypothetical protein